MANEEYSLEIVSRKEAIELGLKYYCTGRLCKRGHASVRFVNGSRCILCAKTSSQEYRASHRERYRELDRRQKKKDREKLKERDKRRYWSNPERARKRLKLYYSANAETIKEKARNATRIKKINNDPVYLKTIIENRVRVKKWRQNNRERVRTHLRNQKAARKLSIGSHTAADIEQILKWQYGKCALCRIIVGTKYHVDHIVALARGGSNNRQNLQVLCATCNLKKGAQDQIDMMRSLGRLL